MEGKLIIFDWDWTLARGEGTTLEKPFRKRGERYEWMRPDMPGILEWLYAGNRLGIATNQGGIAFGFQDWDETEHAIFTLLKQLSFPIPMLISPYHEQRPEQYREYVSWRKPNCRMMYLLWWLYPEVEQEDVLVVGDREEDEKAAKNAGFAYRNATGFFTDIAEEIRDADSDDVDPEYLPPTGEVLSPEERALIDDEPPF